MINVRTIRFTKMHGAGNDYIYLDCMKESPGNPVSLSVEISDRHFGVGSDGLVLIMPSDKADFRMRMFNADGSEAQMCGNASRCVGKFVYERGLTDKREITLETLSGIKTLSLDVDKGVVKSVTVNMGTPVLTPSLVPAKSLNPEIKLSERETVGGSTYEITAVSMGNPHAVVFVDDITDELVLQHGPELETAEIFPEKANIEFVKVKNDGSLLMRVWERGSGETLACGTGACAAAVASFLNGLAGRETDVELPGGTLHIRWSEEDGNVYLTGPAEFICDGVFYSRCGENTTD